MRIIYALWEAAVPIPNSKWDCENGLETFIKWTFRLHFIPNPFPKTFPNRVRFVFQCEWNQPTLHNMHIGKVIFKYSKKNTILSVVFISIKFKIPPPKSSFKKSPYGKGFVCVSQSFKCIIVATIGTVSEISHMTKVRKIFSIDWQLEHSCYYWGNSNRQQILWNILYFPLESYC